MRGLILCLLLTGCGSAHTWNLPVCDAVPSADDARPDVLVIGDSVSIGYTPHLQAALPGYDIVHNPCNAMYSRNGLRRIDEWLAMRPTWDAITFNHGLWDVASWIDISEQEYAQNLRAIAGKVKAVTPKPLFILTTHVPPGTPYRQDADVQRYNEIARQVMQELGIPVLDLYTPSLGAEHVGPGDVHYTDNGSAYLSSFILNVLNL